MCLCKCHSRENKNSIVWDLRLRLLVLRKRCLQLSFRPATRGEETVDQVPSDDPIPPWGVPWSKARGAIDSIPSHALACFTNGEGIALANVRSLVHHVVSRSGSFPHKMEKLAPVISENRLGRRQGVRVDAQGHDRIVVRHRSTLSL